MGEGKRKKDVEEIRCLRVDDEGESLDFDSAVQKITRGELRFHSRVTDEHFLFLKIKCSIKPHEEMLINKGNVSSANQGPCANLCKPTKQSFKKF